MASLIVVADEGEELVDNEGKRLEYRSKEIFAFRLRVNANEARTRVGIVIVATESREKENTRWPSLGRQSLQLREIIEETSFAGPINDAATAIVKGMHEMNVDIWMGQVRVSHQRIDSIRTGTDFTR